MDAPNGLKKTEGRGQRTEAEDRGQRTADRDRDTDRDRARDEDGDRDGDRDGDGEGDAQRARGAPAHTRALKRETRTQLLGSVGNNPRPPRPPPL